MAYKDKHDPRLKESRRKWYYNNKEKQKEYKRIRDQDIREWAIELKSHMSCKICGENHPSCLEFHHTDYKEKISSIGKMIKDGWSKENILKEIEKCEILCPNCHRKHHWEERKNKSDHPWVR